MASNPPLAYNLKLGFSNSPAVALFIPFASISFFIYTLHMFVCFYQNSLQSIPSRSKVYDSYGQKYNHRFLLNYGFVIDKNAEVDGV